VTNEELRRLCERVLADDPKMTVHPVRLADECLRLLAQCEAMQKVVEAVKRRWSIGMYKDDIHHELCASMHAIAPCDCGGEKLRDAISYLEEH